MLIRRYLCEAYITDELDIKLFMLESKNRGTHTKFRNVSSVRFIKNGQSISVIRYENHTRARKQLGH